MIQSLKMQLRAFKLSSSLLRCEYLKSVFNTLYILRVYNENNDKGLRNKNIIISRCGMYVQYLNPYYRLNGYTIEGFFQVRFCLEADTPTVEEIHTSLLVFSISYCTFLGY